MSILELKLVETLDLRGRISLSEGNIGTSNKSIHNSFSILCEEICLWGFL